ncbi:MAG: lyase family protein [Nanoarchaeota archaeon]
MNRDLVSRLSEEERVIRRHALRCISPDDAKYGKTSSKLQAYLSAEAEWIGCAYVQKVLLETRAEFGQAEQRHVDEVEKALEMIDPLNMALMEENPPEKGGTRHDQLAVIDEIGRFVSEETKALLHPGTTSYDILDTIRSYLFKKAWTEVIRSEVASSIKTLCDLASKSDKVLQVGRTHLQNTSPITFGLTLSGYAARLADRLHETDRSFGRLRGKVSGIVGTGASIDMVIGLGESIDFEKKALEKLGLEPDYTATQVVQKERLADVGHSLTTLMHVLGDFANDIRILYSSAINEVTSRDNAARLGGSSADALKNNPINFENIAGTPPIVESGMRILYAMISTDLQRDLRGSKQARYQPQLMMAETYESFVRLNKALVQLSVNEDVLAKNLEPVRKNPSEAMVAILRGEGWTHSQYGVGHDFVKEMGKKAKQQGRTLMDVSLEDQEFSLLFGTLSDRKQAILKGRLEGYLGSTGTRIQKNIDYARNVIGGN